MGRAKLTVALRGGGGLQHRRQRFAVQCAALTQVGGLVHPPGRLGAADPQPIGQHRGQFAAQYRRLHAGQLVDQRVLDRRL